MTVAVAGLHVCDGCGAMVVAAPCMRVEGRSTIIVPLYVLVVGGKSTNERASV